MNAETNLMRKPLVPLLAAVAGTCFGVAAAVAAGSDSPSDPRQPSPPSADGIDVQVPDSNDRVETYWTEDRMRAAKPMPTPRIKRSEAPPAADDDGSSGE